MKTLYKTTPFDSIRSRSILLDSAPHDPTLVCSIDRLLFVSPVSTGLLRFPSNSLAFHRLLPKYVHKTELRGTLSSLDLDILSVLFLSRTLPDLLNECS